MMEVMLQSMFYPAWILEDAPQNVFMCPWELWLHNSMILSGVEVQVWLLETLQWWIYSWIRVQ